jgi:predicted nucleic acid-binding protein
VIADTSVLVDFLRAFPRNRPPHPRHAAAKAWVRRALLAGTLRTSAVAAHELWQGARDPREQEKVAALLAACEGGIAPFTGDAARHSGHWQRTLASGSAARAQRSDFMIAGTCLDAGEPLATRDRGFEAIAGLELAPLD